MSVIYLSIRDNLEKHHIEVKDIDDFSLLNNDDKNKLKVSISSKYGDNIWLWNKEYPTLEITLTKIDFGWQLSDSTLLTDGCNAQLLESVKDFVYSLIVDPPMRHPKIQSITRYVKSGPKHLVFWMSANYINSFSDITKPDINEFLKFIKALPNKNEVDGITHSTTLASRVNGLSWLYEQRNKINDGLLVNPWADITVKKWAASNAEGNKEEGKTPEIPDNALRALFDKTKLIIDDYTSVKKSHDAFRHHMDKQAGNPEGYDWNNDPLFTDSRELKKTLKDIRVACYVIIALFTGMRINEVLSLKTFCVQKKEINGRTIHYLSTRQRKYLPEDKEDVLWQAPTIVLQAVKVMTELFSHYRNNDYLFTSLYSKESHQQEALQGSCHRAYMASEIKKITTEWHLPGGWQCTSHQFRKTFARMMIRQGMGFIELMKQLKQVNIEVTRRYGDLDLRNELAAEQFVLTEEKMTEYIAGSKPIIGGGREKLINLRQQYLGRTVNDRDEFIKNLSSITVINKTLYGDCLYNPRTAKCGGKSVNCMPEECDNAVILATDDRMKELIYRQAENKRLLRTVKSKLQKEHLKKQISKTEKLLSQLPEEIES